MCKTPYKQGIIRYPAHSLPGCKKAAIYLERPLRSRIELGRNTPHNSPSEVPKGSRK